MGNNCKASCSEKTIEKEIKKIDPKIIKSAIKIQSHFRGFKARKKFKQEVISLYQYKKKRLFNIVSQLSIKQSWELYFAFKQEFDFSINGLRKLRSKINEFYNGFFKITNAHLKFSIKKAILNKYSERYEDSESEEEEEEENEINTNKKKKIKLKKKTVKIIMKKN